MPWEHVVVLTLVLGVFVAWAMWGVREGRPDSELPTTAELSGSDPDFTGDMTTQEYMDKIRGRS